MNKLFLLSHIKGLIFVLKSSIEYNIDFIQRKKGEQTKSLLQTQNIYLSGFNTNICFQNYQTYYFFCSQVSKFSIVKKIFLDQIIFPQSMKFPWIKEFSRKFSTKKLFLMKESFHKQGGIPQSKKFSTRKCYLIKEIFKKQRSFPEIFFP